jgi:hypothetical protein
MILVPNKTRALSTSPLSTSGVRLPILFDRPGTIYRMPSGLRVTIVPALFSRFDFFIHPFSSASTQLSRRR